MSQRRLRKSPASLNTNVVLFDHRSPAIELLFDDGAKFIWRISDRLHVESFVQIARGVQCRGIMKPSKNAASCA